MDEERNNLRLAAYAILVGFALMLILCGFVACGRMTTLADEPKIIMNGEYVENNPQAGAVDIQDAPPINRISEALDQADIDQYYYFDMGRISDPDRQLEGVAIEKGWVYDETLPWSKEEQIKQFLGISPKYEYLGIYYVTRYCSCRKCSGKWGTTSASGRPLVVNYSCASPLPFGTVVEIEGYGRCEVVDRTSDKTVRNTGGKIIDIYTSNHAEAEEWGCKKLKVWKVE